MDKKTLFSSCGLKQEVVYSYYRSLLKIKMGVCVRDTAFFEDEL